jgi:hypothetical protein
VALAGTDGTVGELDLAAAAAAADANAESRVNPVASTAAQTVNLGAPAGALAYSRDGRLVAAGTDDGRMHVWSAGGAAPGTGPRRFEGHRSAIAAVGFDRDGERVVAVAQDGSIRLWDLASGRAIGSPLPGPARPAGRPALSADGRAVAMPVVVADTPAAAAEAPGERSPLAGLRPAPTPAGPMAARAGSSTSREPVVVPAALTRTVVDPPQGPKAVDAARNALPVQQWPSPTAEASKNAAPAQQRVLPNSPPAAPPAATPAPAPALTPSPSPPVPGHGVQRWRLDPPPDPPRPSLSALANRLPGVLPAGAWWALGGVVFLLYAVHGVARAARLRRWLGSKGAP